MRRIGVQRMLDRYITEGWATGGFTRRLVGSLHMGYTHIDGMCGGKQFKACWRLIRGHQIWEKELVIGMLPNGLMLYKEPHYQSCSNRAYNLITGWVSDVSRDTGRRYIVGDNTYQVRTLTIPEFNIVTISGFYGESNRFATHLAENLATSDV